MNPPKILHLYWNEGPMSELQTLTVTTFHQLNPDWRIMVYVPTQAYDGNYRSANLTHIQDYVGRDFFHVVKGMPYVNITKINLDSYNIPRDIHDILRSDIFRYHILSTLQIFSKFAEPCLRTYDLQLRRPSNR